MPILVFNLEERSPFDKVFRLAKGALLPELEVQLINKNAVVPLGSSTVTFSMDDEAGVSKISNVAGTVTDAPNGKVKYVFVGTDTDTEGRFVGQFSITESGKSYKIPENTNQRLIIEIGPSVN